MNVDYSLRNRRFWKDLDKDLGTNRAFEDITLEDAVRFQTVDGPTPDDQVALGPKSKADVARVFGAWGLPTNPITWAELRGNMAYVERLFQLLEARRVGYQSKPEHWTRMMQESFPEDLGACELYLREDVEGLRAHHEAHGTFARNAKAYEPWQDKP